MTNDYRAMCAELLAWAERTSSHYYKQADVISRARALLDQPVAEGTKPVVDYIRVPEIATESQIRSAAQYLVKKQNCDGDLIPAIKYAIARWGHPTPQPVAEGPTDEEIADWHDQCADLTRLGEADHYWAFDLRSDEVAGVVCAALARWGRPTPQPVAVSERLPGPEDCLDEGWAWFFNKRIGWRQAVLPVSPGYTHWLPANSLPIPEATND